MNKPQPCCRILNNETAERVAWCERTLIQSSSPHEAARAIALRLGVYFVDGRAEVGFWAPELREKRVLAEDMVMSLNCLDGIVFRKW